MNSTKITKPFGMMALLSRIKAVIRRYEKSDSSDTQKILEVEGLKVDLNKHTVFADDKQIFLTVKEFDLLTLLIKNRGNVLTREKLLDSIWKIDADIESRSDEINSNIDQSKNSGYGNMKNSLAAIRRRLGK